MNTYGYRLNNRTYYAQANTPSEAKAKIKLRHGLPSSRGIKLWQKR